LKEGVLITQHEDTVALNFEVRVGLVLADLDMRVLWNLEEQNGQLQSLRVRHRPSNVHRRSHNLRVQKVNVPLLEFLYRKPLLDQF
jgi:hypothetical protein